MRRAGRKASGRAKRHLVAPRVSRRLFSRAHAILKRYCISQAATDSGRVIALRRSAKRRKSI